MKQIQVPLEEQNECPVCNIPKSDSLRFLTYKDSWGIEGEYFRCPQCGLWYQDRRIADDYVESCYKNLYRDDIDGMIKTQEQRAIAHHNYLESFHLLDRRMLDYGCSTGRFVLMVRDAEGCEWNEVYRQRGIDDGARIYEYPPDKTYEVILLSHVLEHVNHPLEFLSTEITPRLEEGGVLLVDVPNIHGDIEAFFFRHPLAFDHSSLTYLMYKAGYYMGGHHHYYDWWGTPIYRSLLTIWRRL